MRVLIGEDEALLREGLTLLLGRSGFEVVAAAGDAMSLLELARTLRPDVVVTDIRMPPTGTDDGLRAALRIRAELPGIGVVVLSQFVQRRYALELLSDQPAGVGYLLKQRISDVRQFTEDVRRVGAGETAIDPEVVTAMTDRAAGRLASLGRLTPRQLDVLELIAQGRSNTAIADRLRVSEKAVVQHTSNIYAELGLPVDADDHRRVLAVIRYLALP